MTKKAELARLLLSLQQELINNNLWSKAPVKKELLESKQPFCHDTLAPEQWLQFVFIAKLEHLIKVGFPLPNKCDITPYLAESLKEHKNLTNITDISIKIDKLLSE